MEMIKVEGVSGQCGGGDGPNYKREIGWAQDSSFLQFTAHEYGLWVCLGLEVEFAQSDYGQPYLYIN